MSTSSLLFDFRGRIDRSRYWMGLAGLYVVVPVLFLIYYGLSWDKLANSGGILLWLVLFGFLSVVVSAFITIATTAIVAKRLHDINLTGFLCLVIAMVPFAFATIGVVALVGILVLGLLPGTDGPNRFDFPRASDPAGAKTEHA